MPAAIRVLVVDDHAAVRTGLLAMLADEPGIAPVGAAASAGGSPPTCTTAWCRISPACR